MNRTFKGMLVNNQEVVHLHLFSEGGLMWCRAAGEQLAGADAARQGLRIESHITHLGSTAGPGNFSKRC